MPLQNRVTPLGAIIACPARGTFMGNRGGLLHDETRRLKGRRWVNTHWIACVLAFRDRHREVMTPRRYTELFFLDEATAFAAGHRPCFECRRGDFNRYAELWGAIRGRNRRGYVAEMDELLHHERLMPDGSKRLHRVDIAGLPDGAFVMQEEKPHLVLGEALLEWSPQGYQSSRPRPSSGPIDLITPPSAVEVIAAGYAPVVHHSARKFAGTNPANP
jgi:hypothetical protein